MKRSWLILILLVCVGQLCAQDLAVQVKEAENLERQLKEDLAYERYRSLTTLDANNVNHQVKCALLAMSIGGREKDKNKKKMFFEMAKTHAEKAIQINGQSADAYYAMSVVAGGMTEVADENKKKIEYVKMIRDHAAKAISLNGEHARAHHVLGKWHYEVSELGWIKKAAIKAIFGGMPEAKLESAIDYMERCKKLDEYYALNYLDLAKAYKADNKPAKAIETLNKLVRLPVRMADDVRWKDEGKKMLQEIQ